MSEPRHRVDPSAAPPAPPVDRWAATKRLLARTAGLSTSRDVREYVDLQRQMNTAVASGRRVVVLSVEPGQGSTTVSALLAVARAALRRDPVLLVDAAAAGPNPLHDMFRTQPQYSMRDLAARPPRIDSRAAFDGLLTGVGPDLWLLPGDPAFHQMHAERPRGPDAGVYAAALSPFSRYFDITVTDLGHAAGQGTVEMLLTRAHALCLVTSATREGLDGVLARLSSLRDDARAPWAGRTVVVVDRPQGDRRSSGRQLRRRPLAVRDIPVTTIDRDAALGPGFPSRLDQLAPETHLAALRLAANVLDTAVPGTTAAVRR